MVEGQRVAGWIMSLLVFANWPAVGRKNSDIGVLSVSSARVRESEAACEAELRRIKSNHPLITAVYFEQLATDVG